MTEREYRSAEGVSRSQLWRLRQSPEKFKYLEENPEKPTPALIFGQMVHKLILEPATFSDEFAICPECDRRTKEGKAIWSAFVSGCGDREIISQEDYDKAVAMRDALLSNDMAEKLLSGGHEIPIFWTDELTGEVCKVRLDALVLLDNSVLIVDYKTTGDASTEAFIRSAISYGYDFQSAMYSEAVKQKYNCQDPTFIFIAQEKDPPFSVNILACDKLFVERGFDTFRELLGIYHDCKQSGNWYGYTGAANTINVMALPAYLAKDNN